MFYTLISPIKIVFCGLLTTFILHNCETAGTTKKINKKINVRKYQLLDNQPIPPIVIYLNCYLRNIY